MILKLFVAIMESKAKYRFGKMCVDIDVVAEKTSGRCGFPGCGETISLEVHHIYPRGVGGGSQVENLVLLCPLHHRYGQDSVHNNNDSMLLIKSLYAPERSLCMIAKQEATTKHKSPAMTEKRKLKLKELREKRKKKKCEKDLDLEKLRYKLRNKWNDKV